VLYVLYEQCSTDSSNRLNITGTKKVWKDKEIYVLQYTFLIFSKANSCLSYSLLKNIVPPSTFFLIYTLLTCIVSQYTVSECLLVSLHWLCLYFTSASAAGSKAKCYKLSAKTQSCIARLVGLNKTIVKSWFHVLGIYAIPTCCLASAIFLS